MRKRNIRRGIICTVVLGAAIAAVLLAIPFGISGGEGAGIVQAPFHPDFVRFLKDRREGKSWGTYTEDGHALGLIPSPLDLSHLKGAIIDKAVNGFPTIYDLRTKNKLTSVKDQGACKAGWAFAALGSLESLLKPAADWDFSEQDLIEKHGFDYDECYGGNADMAVAYLASWKGPLRENQHPYEYSTIDGAAPCLHVQNVVYIPKKASPLDNGIIKNAVMKYGAVYVPMYWFSSCYNPTHKAYYYEGSIINNNHDHAVCIVGWDDNFSKTKFNNPKPKGNGAFIAKNSWGTSWGENGYFYASYYDSHFGRRVFNVAIQGEPVVNYKKVYQYDPLGCTAVLHPCDQKRKGWIANIFTAGEDGQLKAVSFYAFGTTNLYEIYVRTNVTAGYPGTGVQKTVKTGTLKYPGYHTVVLPQLVHLVKGQKFSIIVKLTTQGYDYWVPTEIPYAGYSSKATASPGQSYISTNGTSWQDFTRLDETLKKANICLKGFTKK